MVANGRNAGNFGYGNAVAVVIFLISLVVALIYQRFVLRRDTAGALTERVRHDDHADHAAAPPVAVAATPPTAARGARPSVYFVALVVIALMLGPVALHHPRRIPHELADHRRPGRDARTRGSVDNYIDVLTERRRSGREVLNSTIVAVATTVGVVVLGLMASYVLARYSFRGPRGAVRAVRRRPHVPDHGGDHAAVHRGAQPRTDELAAPASSCRRSRSRCRRRSSSWSRSCAPSPTRSRRPPSSTDAAGSAFFWRMVLPLAVPGVITVGILAFIGSWNSYLLPLFILNDEAQLHAAARRAGVLVAVLGRTPRRCSRSPRCR